MSDKGQPKNKAWPECCKDCTHEWQSKELTPDSNELLNIFLIILGGLAFFIGIMGYFPTIFAGITLPPDLIAWISVLGPTNFILGAFALLAGIGMFKEQEWAWGMALMVLVFIIANTIGFIINLITTLAFDWTSIIFWLQLVSVVFAVLGIPWLLATKARYR
jgi:preprotein translocase subunit Sss1